jgi:hypothetical protein
MGESSVLSLEELQKTLILFESDWPDLLNEDCNPLNIALTLIDKNGLLNYEDFRKLKKQFTKNLQKAVNANYMSFNDSIGSYGISIETLNQSQDKLSNIRECLGSVDQLINSKSNILAELNEKRMEHTQTLNVLEKISEVQKKLNILQNYIENQDFEKSIELIKEIIEIANNNRLFNIDALQSLQIKLNSLINLLLDELINEIESNIYSRSSTDAGSNSMTTSNRIPIKKGLMGFIKKLNNQAIDEDEELEIKNGNFDQLYENFKYVQKINKESDCLLKLVGNCEREIKQIIKRSVIEIKNKYPSQFEMNLSTELNNKNDPFSSFNLLQSMNGIIIKELFGNIFKKLLFLLQRHFAINEISKLGGYKYRIDKIWREVQKQLSLVIFNYIIDEDLLNNLEELDLKLSKKNSDSPFNKIPKQFESSENGPIFQFSKLSLNSLSNDLINSLNNVFTGQGKGIILSEFNSLHNKSENSIFIGIDDLNESKKNILVPPNIFNMAYIIDEFIEFINNLSMIYPKDDKNNVTAFFNQFMDVVFVSQLENTLIYQFDKLCENKWKPNRLLEASVSFKAFFNKVLILLDTSLYYRPSYVQIIFKMLNKMNDKFKEMKILLFKTNESKLLAKWINDSKLKSISNDIVKNLLNNGDLSKLEILQSKELTYALSIGGNYIPNINPNNFLKLEHMTSLVDLLASLSSILNWLPELKIKIPDLFEDVGLLQKLKETWVLSIFNDSDFPISKVNLNSESNIGNNNDEIIEFSNDDTNNLYSNNNNNNNNNNEFDIQPYLAIDSKAEIEFNNLLNNLKPLMNDVETLIRYEIRVECVWCMIQMMLNKQWEKNGDESVDSGVDKFCERVNNINRIFNRVSKNILNKSKDEVKIRIFGGLGFWIDRLAIFESRRIEIMGQNGWIKMIVNLRVLQQVIKSINNDIDYNLFISNDVNDNIKNYNTLINNSLRYFTIGNEGENFIMKIDKIKEEGLILSEEDWKNLIRLIYSEKLRKGDVGNVTKKYMAAQARLLKGLAIKGN